MADFSIKTAFNAGELSPSLFGRVDYGKFDLGASTLRNFFASYRGGAYSRAGTAFVGYSKQNQGVAASGYIDFTAIGNPAPGSTITLNGVVWTFVASGATGNQTNIGGTVGFTINTLKTDLNASALAALTVATYSQNATTFLIITYDTRGSAGNAYTLAASAATPSGAHLTGGTGDLTNPPRIITFQFSQSQGLLLEFGDAYMRVISNGAYVTTGAAAITGISRANPAEVTSGITLSNGDWVYISGVGGMTEVNGQTYIAQGTGGGNFTLTDVFGVAINSSAFSAYTAGGTAAEIYTLTTPYAAEDLKFLKFTQSADVMSLTLVNQTTGVEYPPYDLARLADDSWTLTVLATGSSIDPPATTSGTATVAGDTNYQYVVTAVDRDTGDESVASDIANIDASALISSTAGSLVVEWSAVAGARYYNIYKAPPAYMSTVPVGSLFEFAGSVYGTRFVDTNIVADASTVPPLHENPFARGQLLDVLVTAAGSGYAEIDFTITTSTGSGAAGYGVLSSSGGLDAVVFTNSGEGYAVTDTITFSDPSGTQASGDIVFVGNPAPGDTITLNGVVWTFVASGTAANTTIIQGTLANTLLFLISGEPGLNISTNPLLTVATYTRTGGNTTLHILYDTNGTGGNAYTLAASVATPSGPHLTGGTGGAGATGTLEVGPEEGTYPSVVQYFQQRRTYANTLNQPDTYWMSQPGAFSNFDRRIPTLDTDSIVGTPWSVQVDGIQFMLPLLGSLMALTGQTVYLVSGTGGSPTAPQPITPASQQALPQAFNGCHFFVAPQLIDYDVYYLQSKGSVIRSASYNFWIGVLNSIDVTYLSSHLFSDYQITAMTWCEEPSKLMWAVRDDGILLSLTSLKSQDVMGWARHDTQGLFLDCSSVTEPPVDALYVVTQRFTPDGNAPYMIERMDNRQWPSVEDAWCVDCALALTPTSPDATLTLGSAVGLGQPVDYEDLVGGADYGAATTITINDPGGSGADCVVTPVIVDGEITDLNLSGGSGYTNPQFQATDPGGTGSGFSATVVLDNSSTCTASSGVFDSGMVGWVIRAGGGVAQITAYTSPTSVTVAIVSPVVQIIPNGEDVPIPFPSGQWTLGDPVATVTGLNHLAGMEVQVLADGSALGARTVAADGTVALGVNASMVVVGLGYQCQLQSLYLDGGGTQIQGRRKNISAVTARLEASANVLSGSNQPDGSTQSPMQVQTTWTNMTGFVTGTGIGDPAYGTAVIEGADYNRPIPLFTGDIRANISSGYEKPGQVAIEQNNPLPVNVLAFVREYDLGDDPEDDSRRRGQ